MTNALSLALLSDDMITKIFLLRKPTTLIGRGADNDIRIDQCGVSSKHALIRVMPSESIENHDDIILQDLGSRNGTIVNNEHVTSHHLRPGDVITIAWVRFKVIDDLGTNDATTAYILLD